MPIRHPGIRKDAESIWGVSTSKQTDIKDRNLYKVRRPGLKHAGPSVRKMAEGMSRCFRVGEKRPV